MLLTHRFAFYPPATASASRGFLQARSCSSACLATYRDCTTRDASEPTSATQHVFDYEHPRLVDSRYRVTRLSPLADRGIERFTTPNSLRRAVRLCFVGGRFLPQTFPSLRSGHEPSDRTSGTSVASPSLTEWRFRTHWSSSGSPRLLLPRVREDHTMSTTRDAFHRQVIASSGLTPSLVDLATLPPRSDSRHCFARPFTDRALPRFPRGQINRRDRTR
jgi:hypothetical protein